MGGHYGTIHVWTEKRDEVRAAVERLGSERTRRFLIAPAIDGWVTVYPEHNGQDSAVSEALARILENKTLIHCLVHDDDVFAYWLFENGSIMDTYNSCPDYFGGANPPPRGGNAQALTRLLRDPNKVNDLQTLLDANSFDFELERQDQFAALLGLPNTAYAYEYLQAGETEGVRQWKGFVHIPDTAPEKAARRAAATEERKELKQLQRDGILLVNEKGEKSGNKHFFRKPLWAIDPSTSSVLLTWQDYFHGAGKEMLWQSFAGPHWQGENWVGPAIESPRGLEFSQAGSWFATVSCHGSQLDIWDRRDLRLDSQRKFTGGVTATAFSADERWLFAIVHNSGPPSALHRLSVQPGLDDAVVAHEVVHFQTIMPHPAGRFLAVVDNFGVLMILDVETLRIVNQVWIKETHSSLPEGLRNAIVNDAAGKAFEELRNHMSAEAFEQYRKQSARHFLPREAIRICCFSPDGEWIFCGTNHGVRGLNWNELLRCEDMQPASVRFSVDAEPVRRNLDRAGVVEQKFIYGVVFDAARQRVLFSGLEGKISFLELNDGRTGDLLVVPGNVSLIELGLTPDRCAVVATGHRMEFGSSKPSPAHFQIWNYRALCQAANLEY